MLVKISNFNEEFKKKIQIPLTACLDLVMRIKQETCRPSLPLNNY